MNIKNYSIKNTEILIEVEGGFEIKDLEKLLNHIKDICEINNIINFVLDTRSMESILIDEQSQKQVANMFLLFFKQDFHIYVLGKGELVTKHVIDDLKEHGLNINYI